MYLFLVNSKTEISEEIIINSKKNNIELFLIKNKRIDAIIVGGSNAVFGISAEDLSKYSNKYFYNFSMYSEMNDDVTYMKFLKLTTPDSIRKKVRLVVYSSIQLFSEKMFEKFENTNITRSQKVIKIIPEISIISWIKIKYKSGDTNYLKNYFEKNGDLANYPEDDYLNDFEFKDLPLSYMIKYIVFKKKQLSLLYPNAKIVVIAPPFYNKTPNYQNNYFLKLSQELEKRNIYFIAEQVSSNKQIWKDNIHLNKFGRKIRSKELYNMLDNKLNHNLFN
jgi:hypothetical protein